MGKPKGKVDPGSVRHEPKRRASRSDSTESLTAALDQVGDKLRLAEGQTPASVEFGIQLKRARVARGMTQTRLAELVGIPQAMISNLERGRGADGPTYATMRKLGDVLGLEVTFAAPADVSASDSIPHAKYAELLARIIKENISKFENDKSKGAHLPLDMISVIRELVKDDLSKLLLKAQIFPDHHRRGGVPENICMWQLSAHAERRFKSSVPTVYYIQNMDKIAVHSQRKNSPARVRQQGHVIYLDARSAVEMANTSSENVLMFSAPASALLDELNGASSK